MRGVIDFDARLPDPADDRVLVECPRCHGSGEEQGPGYPIDCGRCGGSGEAWVSEEEE